jgi:hypothetical protein
MGSQLPRLPAKWFGNVGNLDGEVEVDPKNVNII